MALETTTIEHNCNTVRRQIQEEFPDLTVHFVVFQKGRPGKALEQKLADLEDHPAAGIVLPAIKKSVPKDGFFIAGRAKEKKFLKFTAREKTLACIFIEDKGLFTEADHVRQHAFASAWHFLKTLDERAPAGGNYKDETDLAWNNMLADAFSALVIEMQGKKGFIRALGRRQSMQTLEAHGGYQPELHPYPVVMDAAQLVYDDMRKAGTLNKSKIIAQALEMTSEIGETFDQSTVLQWWAFARPAQDLAWLGVDKNKILGAAVHTSEDPYARSTAYLVAESLNIDSVSFSDISLYNPFTDQEANERHHRRLCEDALQNLLDRGSPDEAPALFRKEALKQNKKLLEGQLIGWCAPGLIAALSIMEKPMSQAARIEEIRRVYAEACRKTNSEILQKLGFILIALRRGGETLTLEKIAEAVRQDDHVLVQDLSDALVIK